MIIFIALVWKKTTTLKQAINYRGAPSKQDSYGNLSIVNGILNTLNELKEFGW